VQDPNQPARVYTLISRNLIMAKREAGKFLEGCVPGGSVEIYTPEDIETDRPPRYRKYR
jgi:hypothetical protein